MKVLNIIWKFTTGGIGKCFLTYAQCNDVKNDIKIISACIDPQNFNYDRTPLNNNSIGIIPIKNRKDLKWINKLYKLIINEKPDLIFTHGLYGPIIIEVTKFFHPSIRKIPMVVSFHGLYNPPTSKTAPLAHILNKTMAWICKYRAERTIIVSKYAGEYLLQEGVPANKLSIVYNGIPAQIPEYPPIELPDDIIKIGFIGRIDEIKGLEYLLEAAAKLKQKHIENFHIYIVGDGPKSDDLKALTKHLNIEKHIDFVGYQNNIASWLNAWDIFVLPSLQENHSIALLEAMRAGKAIICTEIGGNKESVTHEKEALLIPCKNSEALELALDKLLHSKELRDFLGNNAKMRFIDNFTEEQTKKTLIEIFKSYKK